MKKEMLNNMSKLIDVFSLFIIIISWLFSIGLILSGFRIDNSGLPIAGSILIYTLVYSEINRNKQKP